MRNTIPSSLYHVSRQYRRHPILGTVITILSLLASAYAILYCLIQGEFGRWYWNYFVTFHASMVTVLPTGRWGPITDPPRWLDPIKDAPWMGTWDVPHLSRNQHDAVIVKIHIFSRSTLKAQSKRNLIRSISPLLNVPSRYHHLVEIKFVVGQLFTDGTLDEKMEASLVEEEESHGDLIRLTNLKGGDNLREGKILEWMRAVGEGRDGGRPGWFVLKMDDDTVLNLPNLLDTLLSLDPHKFYYLGTSLARWPAYHFHFTGILTGYSWPVLKTLAAGIANLRPYDVEFPWDDDVLMGELMFILPSKPSCHPSADAYDLPSYCDPREPPPDGYLPPPPSPDPRTDLIRYDFLRRAGDEKLWWLSGDIARHGWPLKSEAGYLAEWHKKIEGKQWRAPEWLEPLGN